MGSPAKAFQARALVRPFFIISSMSYLVIARKWRPQTFSDVVGQEHITRTLQNAISAGRLAHAYLFTGVRGVGKTTAARILAKALNCAKGPTPEPCNHCSQCQEISQGSSIDVLEIDGASNRGIDEIRQIIENVRYQPAHGRFKIYIIDEVHQVTKDAFNALLKTLEEPPPSVKFILATTEPHRLPPTILSRCQRYDFRRIELREIINRLNTIAKSEALEITPGALALLAREGDGSMRDAQSLLEQVLAMAAPGTAETARVDEALLQDVLGLADRRMLYDISAAVLSGNSGRCVELVAQAAAQGRDINRLARDLVEHFRNLLVARLADADVLRARDPAREINTRVLDLPDQEIADLRAQAEPVALETLLDYFDFMAVGAEENRFIQFALHFAKVFVRNVFFAPSINHIYDFIFGIEQYYVIQAKRNVFHSFFYQYPCFFFLMKGPEKSMTGKMIFECFVFGQCPAQILFIDGFEQVIDAIMLKGV